MRELKGKALPCFRGAMQLLLLLSLCIFCPEISSAQTSQKYKKESDAKAPDFVSPDMGKDVTERVNKTLEDYEKNVDKIESGLKKFEQQNFRKDNYTVDGKQYKEMPKKHPLLESKGVATTSQEDYTKKDTRVMFNQKTFGQCFEERQVHSGPYFEECKKRCPQGLVTYFPNNEELSCLPCIENHNPLLPKTPCKNNQMYVSEYYWPVYVSRTYPGRAMGSFDPKGGYLNGQDQDGSLAFDTVKSSALQEGKKEFSSAMEKYYGKKIPEGELNEALPEALWNAAEYAGRDVDFSDQSSTENQALHTLVYMTNANRQLSRRFRPGKKDYWKGYMEEDRCFFQTLPDPKRKAVAKASYSKSHGKFTTFAANLKDISEPGKRGSPYGTAMLDEGPNVYKLMQNLDQEFEQDPKHQPKTTNSSMLGQYIEMETSGYSKKGLERVGTESSKHYQDWLYHGFFRLPTTRNTNYLQDPLYASIASGFSFYALNSLDIGINEGAQNRRPNHWSFYQSRPSGKNKAYAGDTADIGPGKTFSTDKIQVIYPTLDDGELGSSCFRPESLAREEYFDPNKKTIDDKIGTQNFWGFRRDLNKRLLEQGIENAHNYVREVRVAYWEKRVSCHCTVCSRKFYGCSVLNTGDVPEDLFYGTDSLENKDPVLTPGGTLRWTEQPIPGNPIPIAKLAPIEKALENLADTALASASELSDFGVSFKRTSDKKFLEEEREDSLFSRPSLKTRAQKVQTGRQANARKVAMEKYGRHAEDEEAVAPNNSGNGDLYALKELGNDDGTPKPAPGTQKDPLQGSDPGGDIPTDSFPPPKNLVQTPLGLVPGLASAFFPPSTYYPPPPVCEQCSRTARARTYK